MHSFVMPISVLVVIGRWQQVKFVHPHDTCFDLQGDIYVAEWVATGRVTKLTQV